MSDKKTDEPQREEFRRCVPLLIVIEQLRRMAAAEEPYRELMDVSPWTKNIWEAAATIIEDYSS